MVDKKHQKKEAPLLSKRRYHRLLAIAGISISLVSIIPLLIMTLVSYLQYQRAFHRQLIRPISRLTSKVKRSLEFFLDERRAALSFVIREMPLEALQDQARLARILKNMKKAFGGADGKPGIARGNRHRRGKGLGEGP